MDSYNIQSITSICTTIKRDDYIINKKYIINCKVQVQQHHLLLFVICAYEKWITQLSLFRKKKKKSLHILLTCMYIIHVSFTKIVDKINVKRVIIYESFCLEK